MRQLDLAAANVASVKWKSPSAVRGWRPQPAEKLCLLTSSLGGASDPSWACLTASIFSCVLAGHRCFTPDALSTWCTADVRDGASLPRRGINRGAECDADTEPRLDAGAKLSQAKRSELTLDLWPLLSSVSRDQRTDCLTWKRPLMSESCSNELKHSRTVQLSLYFMSIAAKCRKLQIQNTTYTYCCHPRKKKHNQVLSIILVL